MNIKNWDMKTLKKSYGSYVSQEMVHSGGGLIVTFLPQKVDI